MIPRFVPGTLDIMPLIAAPLPFGWPDLDEPAGRNV